MASGLFRFIGALGRNVIVANTFGSCALLTVIVMGGFILSRGKITDKFGKNHKENAHVYVVFAFC